MRTELAYQCLDHSWPVVLQAIWQAAVSSWEPYTTLAAAIRANPGNATLEQTMLDAYWTWQAIEELGRTLLGTGGVA